MSIEKITDRDLKNCEKVYKFVRQYSKSYKISNIADKDEIKNIAITTLNNNRDLITPELRSKIDLCKILIGVPSDITDEDMETIYSFLTNNYCNEDIIMARYIKKCNDLLYEYIKEVDYNIDYTYLYMYFRNNDLEPDYYNYYPKGYPALLVKYLHEFTIKYNTRIWRKFYLNDFVVTDILSCFISINDNYKGKLKGKCFDILYMDLPDIKNNSKDFESFYNENKVKIKEIYSGPIFYEQELDPKTLDNQKDYEFTDKLMGSLDNYYITKFYNNILIKSNYREYNTTPNDDKFMEIIFSKYHNFIGDMDKIVDMFKDDEDKESFKSYLNNSYTKKLPIATINIVTDFRKYIMEKYENKTSLSYDEVKEYLL